MGKRPTIDTESITRRLDVLGWPDVLDSRSVRYTLNCANVRTQRVPKVLATLGYVKMPNPASKDGTFYKRFRGSYDPGTRLTLYRREGAAS
jgi:hypothetical protein